MRGLSSWWLCRSGQRQTRQYMTWGSPFLWDTWGRGRKRRERRKRRKSKMMKTMKRMKSRKRRKRRMRSFTWSLPSRLLGIVTHFVLLPGLLRAVSRASIAP